MDTKELDNNGHEIRFYKVMYARNLATGERIYPEVIMSEWQLKQMLYDDSKYDYLVLSAELVD